MAATTPPSDESRTLSFSATGGMVVLGQSFHSNGELRAGRLGDYQYTSEGIGARAEARASFPLGRVFHVGVGGFYQYAGATGTRATAYDANGAPSTVQLSLESHAAAVTLMPGVHVGGVDVDLAAGPVVLVNYIGIDARAPLPSDRTIGLFTGVHVDAPALVHVGRRALGLTLDGGFVEIAQHDQTANLEDGDSASSRALMGGVEVAYGLLPESESTQLSVVLGYHGGLQTSRYSGPSVRNGPANGNATSAERVQETQLASLGLRLAH